jgi:hypothetical protein
MISLLRVRRRPPLPEANLGLSKTFYDEKSAAYCACVGANAYSIWGGKRAE